MGHGGRKACGVDKEIGLILRRVRSIDCRRRALGLRTELLRMRVLYECECEERQADVCGVRNICRLASSGVRPQASGSIHAGALRRLTRGSRLVRDKKNNDDMQCT